MLKQPVHYIDIDEAFSGQRIDNFLITHLKSIPKTRIYRILRKGEVRVNKKRVDPSYRLQEGDSIRIPPLHIEEKADTPRPTHRLTALLKERILFEDKNILVLNKPAGVAVHGGSNVPIGIIEALKTLFPKLPQLELVHRLDLETSGCLVLAKKRSVLREIHALLREGKVKKTYLALTQGNWEKENTAISVSLKKNYLKSGERVVKVDSEGKASKTLFKKIKKFKNANLMEVNLETGRTHQIRVHAQYAGHPLAGDSKYGDKSFNKEFADLGLKRLFLHAKSIKFSLAKEEKPYYIEAPLDQDLAVVLEKLE